MDDARMSSFNHTGQVVTDLERSQRFYEEVLGFRYWYAIAPPDEPTAKLLGLAPPVGMQAVYLTLDGLVLELMQLTAPGATAEHRPRTMAEPGLTHLSISVDDVRATAARAVELGGAIVEDSDIGAALFIRDPDGQLVELLPTGYQQTRPPRS
jgi:catechol 2,3-dioxygenase-like lactoylglutathione lyase family enzyme